MTAAVKNAALARFWLTYRTTWDLGRALDDAFVVLAERLLPRERPAPPSSPVAHEVLRLVCQSFAVEPEQVLGPSRVQALVRPRMVMCWVLAELGLSYPAIGRIVGRDHSTVIFARDKVAQTGDLLVRAEEILKAMRVLISRVEAEEARALGIPEREVLS